MQQNQSYRRQLMCILQDLRSIWHFFLASISEVSEQIPAEEMFQEKGTDGAHILIELDCYQLVVRLLVQNTTHYIVLLQVLCNWMGQTDKNRRQKKDELRKLCRKMSSAGVREDTIVLY